MIQKFLSKYGLAVHLAVLAALPLALTPFLTAATLASVTLWLSALAAVWFFTEPSLRQGEHISSSRARLRRELAVDPFFWFAVLLLVYGLVRWLNAGIALHYDPEQAVWAVRDPSWAGFPASTPSAGLLPLTSLIALSFVVLGLRNGVGASGRVMFGLVGSFAAGLGGFSVAACACYGAPAFVAATKTGFGQCPFGASAFGIWLVISICAGVIAEGNRWALARLLFIFGVGGNLAALLFFAPPLVAVCWLALGVAALVFGLVYLARTRAMSAVTHAAVLTVFGMAIPIFMIMTFMTQDFLSFKQMNLDPAVAFSESARNTSAVLTRLAKSMWTTHPWFGVGEGAFGLYLPFLAEKGDWAVLPLKVTSAYNGYFMVLAERGVGGLLFLVAGLCLLIATYVMRLLGGMKAVKASDEGKGLVFGVSPSAWALPLTVVPVLAEACFSPVLSMPAFVLTAAIPLALAASSFPKAKKTSLSTGHEVGTATQSSSSSEK